MTTSNPAAPRIQQFPGKSLLGLNMKMSLADNRTGELWRSFMQQRQRISNAVGTDLYSVQIFPKDYFAAFSPHKEFTKWATTEVGGFDAVPEGMQTLTIPAGLYAVFLHKGAGSDSTEDDAIHLSGMAAVLKLPAG